MDIIDFVWINGLSFIFILSVIVFGHEMGHYLIARYNGVRVEVFSIGFGPELFGWSSAVGTRWKVSLLPLGGYVKMFGDADAASKPGEDLPEMSPEDRAVSFHHKRLGQRAAIVLGGPVANFILAIIILACMFATVGQRITPAEVSSVQPGSPAAIAGIMPGDRIVAIDGAAVENFLELKRIVSESAGKQLNFGIVRNGEQIEIVVAPEIVEEEIFGAVQLVGRIGVVHEGSSSEFKRYGPLDAIWNATTETFKLSKLTLEALGQMIAGTRDTDELGGPIRIAQISGQVAEDGMVTVFWFMAVLSINLGLINLFPIPMLDGGHLLLYAVEAIRGKPVGERAQEYSFRFGLAVILTLMIFATWKDIERLKWVDFVINLFS